MKRFLLFPMMLILLGFYWLAFELYEQGVIQFNDSALTTFVIMAGPIIAWVILAVIVLATTNWIENQINDLT